jgi:hypothetical protein
VSLMRIGEEPRHLDMAKVAAHFRSIGWNETASFVEFVATSNRHQHQEIERLSARLTELMPKGDGREKHNPRAPAEASD